MKLTSTPKMASHLLFFPLFLLVVLVQSPSYSTSSDYYTACSNTFSCGNIQNIGFPFYGNLRPKECGHPNLSLNCDKNQTFITINGVEYLVKAAEPENQILRIARKDYLDDLCPSKLIDSNLDRSLFVYGSEYRIIRLIYGCPSLIGDTLPGNFTCPSINGVSFAVWDGFPAPTSLCRASVVVPVDGAFGRLDFGDLDELREALRKGFDVKWVAGVEECENCRKSGGVCGYDWSTDRTTCYFDDRSSATSEKQTAAIAGGVAAGIVALIAIAVAFWLRRCCKKLTTCKIIRRRGKENDQHIMEFIRNQEAYATKKYSYSDVKKMTNKFADKLGQGGYGSVYKGRLPDGRPVAVKLLSESRENGEEFMNEVASISRTSHINVVSMLGFCYEGSKRALIYEFMSNGSLDKFSFNRGTSSMKNNLEWKTLYEIAIGIARGLEYLHQGCNFRILHLDIKPHNILLDAKFCPKISDFGLAKLCNRDASAMSMLGPRGTIGYIAPEVFSRNFGRVSYKSDVYSYGMMVFEMVGARNGTDFGLSHTSSEVYFLNHIYKSLKADCSLKVDGVTNEEEEKIFKKMVLVSLWCIQINPSKRPSMTRVLEMLEGSHQSLPFPPLPLLSSPPRSPPRSNASYSTTS